MRERGYRDIRRKKGYSRTFSIYRYLTLTGQISTSLSVRHNCQTGSRTSFSIRLDRYFTRRTGDPALQRERTKRSVKTLRFEVKVLTNNNPYLCTTVFLDTGRYKSDINRGTPMTMVFMFDGL